MFLDLLVLVLAPLQSFAWWLLGLWWLWLFFVLVYTAYHAWMAYIQEYFKRVTTKWVLLELRIPREIKNTPRAMEQIFATVHALKNSASDYQETYWDGEVPHWFSFEAASFGGEIHFYLYVPVVRRNHVEAAFYANYPDIEITEVPPEQDYVHRLYPTMKELYKNGYRLFGNELIFPKKKNSKHPEVYPIRTYLEFEATTEEREVDPVGQLVETLARLKPQEHIWLQILARPKVDDFITAFHKAGEDEIDVVKKKARYLKDETGEVLKDDTGYPLLAFPSPGETEAMKAIDRKISKPAFDVVIRYLYIAPKEIFSMGFGRRSVFSVMNQYRSESLNYFNHHTRAWTLAKVWYKPWIFPGRRAAARRDWMWEKYQMREMYPSRTSEALLKMRLFNWGFVPWSMSNLVLNTEELATIYHMPTIITLTGPLIKRVEARRGGPPAGLPIYGEEGEEDLPLE